MPGETIETIATKLNISGDELKKINGIKSGIMLRPGSYIIIPTRKSGEYKTYIVKQGDNMYSIAKQNNVDYKTLLSLNGLNENDYIYPNQEIIIPIGNMYVTKETDTVEKVLTSLNIPVDEINELFLKEDQIIRY